MLDRADRAAFRRKKAKKTSFQLNTKHFVRSYLDREDMKHFHGTYKEA